MNQSEGGGAQDEKVQPAKESPAIPENEKKSGRKYPEPERDCRNFEEDVQKLQRKGDEKPSSKEAIPEWVGQKEDCPC